MLKRFFLSLAAAALTAGGVAAADGVNDALRSAFTAMAGPLDGAVNTLLADAGAANREATRTVPLINADGSSTGGAQIVGPRPAVDKVRAVVRVTSSWQGTQRVTIAALVPVDRIEHGPRFHRVYGVAVDALVSF